LRSRCDSSGDYPQLEDLKLRNLAPQQKGENLLLPKHRRLRDPHNRDLATMGHTHADTSFFEQIGGALARLQQPAPGRELNAIESLPLLHSSVNATGEAWLLTSYIFFLARF
jgi:hypothetical protein